MTSARQFPGRRSLSCPGSVCLASPVLQVLSGRQHVLTTTLLHRALHNSPRSTMRFATVASLPMIGHRTASGPARRPRYFPVRHPFGGIRCRPAPRAATRPQARQGRAQQHEHPACGPRARPGKGGAGRHRAWMPRSGRWKTQCRLASAGHRPTGRTGGVTLGSFAFPRYFRDW